MPEPIQQALVGFLGYVIIKFFPYRWWCTDGLRRLAAEPEAPAFRWTMLRLTLGYSAGLSWYVLLSVLDDTGGWSQRFAAGLLPIHWLSWSILSWSFQAGRDNFSLLGFGDDLRWRFGGFMLSLATDLVGLITFSAYVVVFVGH